MVPQSPVVLPLLDKWGRPHWSKRLESSPPLDVAGAQPVPRCTRCGRIEHACVVSTMRDANGVCRWCLE